MNILLLSLSLMTQGPYLESPGPAAHSKQWTDQGYTLRDGLWSKPVQQTQACGPNGCGVLTSSTRFSPIDRSYAAQCVRVERYQGGQIGYGNGTIVGIRGGKALVLTAKHVLGNGNGRFICTSSSARYTGNYLGVDPSYDLGALEIVAPPGAVAVSLADTQPRRAYILGYRLDGRYHSHGANLQEVGSDAFYGTPIEEGDSGAGVWDASGRYAGVAWGTTGTSSASVRTAVVRRFVEYNPCCRWFRLFGRANLEIGGGYGGGFGANLDVEIGRRPRYAYLEPSYVAQPYAVQQPIVYEQQPYLERPVAPVRPQVIPQPIVEGSVGRDGAPGPQGPQGPPGPPGMPGRDGQSADLGPVMARLEAIEQLALKPITFVTPTPDGRVSVQQVHLGDRLGVKVPGAAVKNFLEFYRP